MMLPESVQIQRAEDTPWNGSEQAERIRAGDRDTYRALFLEHYEALCRYTHRYIDSLEVVEDLVQEVFFDLWKRRATWYPRHSPRAYLFGAVRNHILKHQRHELVRNHVRGQEAINMLPSLEDPEESFQYEEFSRMTREAIDELPPRCRHVFILSREHDLTYAEIATAVGISIKTVETHMGRALQHLRDRLSSLRP